jgi:hypothetical protein
MAERAFPNDTRRHCFDFDAVSLLKVVKWGNDITGATVDLHG